MICDFSSKKAANTPPETLGKFENAYLIYINFICQWAFRSTNCIAVLSVKLPHAAAPPLVCDRVIFLSLHNQIDKENYFCVSFFDCRTVPAGSVIVQKTGMSASDIPVCSAESSVNSGEKPAGCYEELTQKTEPKIVETSSVFLETDDIFRACFAITHL